MLLTRPHADRPASTRPVTNCADDGSDGSLRRVMSSAENGDVIDMSQLTCSTITLTQGAIDFDVDNLTLQGPGQNALTIDGNNADRVFTIYTSNGTNSISDLTIAHGFIGGSAYATGGCVYSYFATPDNVLILTRVTVTSCTAGDAQAVYAGGGGVLTYGALTLESSTISGNHVTAGPGASYVAGGVGTLYNATIIGSTVTGNTRDRNFAWHGRRVRCGPRPCRDARYGGIRHPRLHSQRQRRRSIRRWRVFLHAVSGSSTCHGNGDQQHDFRQRGSQQRGR